MNQQKVTQVLKEIFDQCGSDIMCNRNRFQSYLEDRLGGNAYVEERLVLRNALDFDTLWPLAKAQTISAEMERQVMEQLQRKNHMSKDAAEFVVRCVILARGGTSGTWAAGMGTASGNTSSSQGTQISPSNVNTSAPPKASYETSCAMTVLEKIPIRPGSSRKREEKKPLGKGTLRLYQDKLTFTPDNFSATTEIAFRDINQIECLSRWVRGISFAISCAILGGSLLCFVLVLIMLWEEIFSSGDFLSYLFDSLSVELTPVGLLFLCLLFLGVVSGSNIQVKTNASKTFEFMFQSSRPWKIVQSSIRQGMHKYSQ